MEISNIKTSYLKNPLGIDLSNLIITWNVLGLDIKFQKGFEIEYQINDLAKKTIYVESDKTEYRFNEKLNSKDEVIFRIRIKNELDEFSDFSPLNYFKIGILNKKEWHAKWIYGDYKVNTKKRYPVDYFKKEFEVDEINKSYLYITALGIYEVYINNQKVGDYYLTPGSTDPRVRIHYDTYEVSSYLKKGKNEILILLADGWFRGSIGAKGYSYVFGKKTMVLAELDLKNRIISTDESWKFSNDGPILFSDLKDGEIVDFNKIPTFNQKIKIGKYDGIISSSNNSHIEKIGEYNFINKFNSKTNHLVFEFENNLAGNIYLKIKGKKNSHIKLILGEMLDQNNDLTLKNIQLIHKKKKTPLQEITLYLKEGINEYHSRFFYGGFKYVSIIENDNVEILEIKQIALATKMDETSSFNCSNELINIFYENTKRSIKSNFVDIPTDCPTRERMGWTGDSQIIFNTASFLFDSHAFFRKHLEDVYDRQAKNGCLPQIAPYSHEDWFMDVMNGSVGWADVGILVPYRMYLKYGDKNILNTYYDRMKKYIHFMIKRCGRAKGIYSVYAKPLHLSKENKKYGVNTGQSYGEWAEPNDVKPYQWQDFAIPHPEESMAYTYYMLDLFIKISNILNKNDDLDLFNEYKNGIKKAYQELITKKDHSIDTDRQCKQVRPLYFNLLDGELEEFAKKRLIKSLDNYSWRLGTGFLSTPFILYVLEKIDPNYAYKLLLNEKMPGWLFMSKNNTGTIWEAWEGPLAQKGIASLNHYSKGALVEWLFTSMLGIKIKENNLIEVSPIIGEGIDFAKGSYSSIYGKIKISWQKIENKVEFNIVVPPNSKVNFIYQNENKLLVPGTYQLKI